MEDELYKAFRIYLESVKSKFNKPKVYKKVETLYALKHAKVELEELENSQEFKDIFDKTLDALNLLTFASSTIGNFFRRSGCYLDIIHGKPVNIDETYGKYIKAFQRSNYITSYLAPLNPVHIKTDDFPIDFGTFQIWRFTNDELKAFFKSDINTIFYPEAEIPLDELKYVPFIYAEESISRAENHDYDQEYRGKDFADWYTIKVAYSEYPKPIESALKKLSLFEWELFSPNRGDPPVPVEIKETQSRKYLKSKKEWFSYEVPFILEKDDNILSPPKQTPDVSHISQSHIWGGAYEFDACPEQFYILDNKRIDTLKKFIQRLDHILSTLKPYRETWYFIEVAFNFFFKAFFSSGIEQLLGHIIVLEALLGERKETEGITSVVAKRIVYITGKTENEKIYKDLYSVRSKLVHGSVSDKKIYTTHLYYSRLLARQVLLWFFNCLNKIAEELPENIQAEKIPKRKDILQFIDLSKNERVKQIQLNYIFSSDFPNDLNWEI